MTFQMHDVGTPITKDRIDRLERTLGIVLPDSYKSFLLRFNGGRPDPSFFPIQGSKRENSGSIHYFFRVEDQIESSTVEWQYKILSGRIPSELFPIAGDGSGNVICLSLKGSNEGFVYFWDHDDEHSPPTYDNIYFVADSFEKFLDSIFYEDLSAEIAKSLGQTGGQLH